MAKRTAEVIEAEISKLTQELDDIRKEERRLTTATHILHNLGWSWDQKLGKWNKPTSKPFDYKVFDRWSANPFREGDWVQNKVTGRKFRVVRVEGPDVIVQEFAVRQGVRLLCHKNVSVVASSLFRSIPTSAL